MFTQNLKLPTGLAKTFPRTRYFQLGFKNGRKVGGLKLDWGNPMQNGTGLGLQITPVEPAPPLEVSAAFPQENTQRFWIQKGTSTKLLQGREPKAAQGEVP